MVILWFSVGFLLTFISLILLSQSKIQVSTNRSDSIYELEVIFELIHGVISVKYLQDSSTRFFQISLRNMILINKTIEINKKGEQENSIKKPKKKPAKKKSNIQKLKDLNWTYTKYRIRKIITSFSRPELSGICKVGFKNPMHTGIMQGVVSSFTGMFPQTGQKLILVPVFTERCLYWDIQFSTLFRIFPIMWHSLLLWLNIKVRK